MHFRLRRLNLQTHSILLLCFLVNFYLPLLIVNHKSAFADVISSYSPPPGHPPRPQRTEGSASRGCNLGEKVSLNLFAPDDHIATTTDSHPTFFWYVSSSQSPSEFTLVKPGVAEPVYVKRLNPTNPGIVMLKLPKNIPGLELGQEYRWTVSIICNKSSPSANPYATVVMKRVEISPQLKQELEGKKEQEKAEIYAQAGIWYNMLDYLSKASITQPKNKTKLEDFFVHWKRRETPSKREQRNGEATFI